jgi:hypothetical protein
VSMIQAEVPTIPHAGSFHLLRAPFLEVLSLSPARSVLLGHHRLEQRGSGDQIDLSFGYCTELNMALPYAEGPCLSCTYTLTGASVCLRLMLMISATIRLGTQLDQAVAWYAGISSIPKAP